MLFSTEQLSRVHFLDDQTTYTIYGRQDPIIRKQSWKILGITFDEHLTRKQHVNDVIISGYYTLITLKKGE